MREDKIRSDIVCRDKIPCAVNLIRLQSHWRVNTDAYIKLIMTLRILNSTVSIVH